ncbi:Histone-lysine N-methyltransferase, H3 lysine-36 and H4 lysine-20 specific [Auxenochlorella protothecoides]|uniref:Histone-lysine N-methyltransferase, H3 lysine-36 and H4 lysine-20 specific n=1 Tax=Auxenochlorella protothecoides TaxID=3075 RepID=A0A087SED2_AUXPR|nr:Histone-lysine N-methyltransferase, H3 lysine-36 and H4 lysine-20 specific [Auxenochlorella protothecoides]KFM24086.1 Histone-lysine N-methyltransferase, H3 lysine-36 and H4 lysine-20 specific [Auxenochlorella protothecoides]
MFFGDYTAAWLAGSQVQRWHEGLTATASKASKNKKLAAALAEAQLFVKHGRAPKGWWTETLVGRNVCKASSEAQASPGKPGGPSKQRKQTAPSVSLHTLAVVPRRVKKEAPTRVDAPVFDVIDGRLVTKAGLPLLTLKRRAGAAALTGKDALPSYLHLRSNAYHTPALKPRRLPPDQVDVCSCQPVARLPRRAALADDMPAAAVAAAVTAAALAPHLGSPPPSRRGGCGPDCLNRLSLTLCDPGTCPAGESCGNRAFHLLPAPRLEVFLTDGKGWGVRCADALAPGTFLAEYAGEADRVIDAGPKGNVARLLNSSCDPNCVAQKWRDAATGEMRVGLFTARQVPAGEELVYNYNFQQFQGGTERGEYACRCGAPNCKGSMDLRALARDPGARESGAAGERGGAEGEMQSPAGRRAGAKEAAATSPRRRGSSRPWPRGGPPSGLGERQLGLGARPSGPPS